MNKRNKTYNKFLSTREVSNLLNVTETTIKRWTEADKLKCSKTLGGHRKYYLEDIIEFSKKNNIPISGILKVQPEKDIEYHIYKKNYGELSRNLLEIMLNEGVEEIYLFLLHLYRNQISFIDIVDEIIVKAFIQIGDGWENNKIEIAEEHKATQSLKMALNRLVTQLQHKTNKNITVICSCMENDYHDLGLLTISFALEAEGYNVIHLGENTPFLSLLNSIERYNPVFVCLSSKQNILDRNYLHLKMNELYEKVKEKNAFLIIGGETFHNLKDKIKSYDLLAGSLKEIIDFIKKTNKQINKEQ